MTLFISYAVIYHTIGVTYSSLSVRIDCKLVCAAMSLLHFRSSLAQSKSFDNLLLFVSEVIIVSWLAKMHNANSLLTAFLLKFTLDLI